ncbi:MAG: flavin reductase family protein [Burkholderiales bacterium]|jgi:flavin reductase (DIM6/NTAB) family NADH-FMN oxidoreductase RutF|nr:flavin reductase family protein [Burkholderiales bacterium]
MADNAATFDSKEYRRALGTYPTGVTVVTTLAPDGAPVGITVNSFASLSLDPPLVLWALNVRSPKLAAFDAASRFAVNVLRDSQIDLSRRFASRHPNLFDGVETKPGLGGVPLVSGVAAHIQCRAHARHEGGDHVILVGRVERFDFHERTRPLVFRAGRYHVLGAELP